MNKLQRTTPDPLTGEPITRDMTAEEIAQIPQEPADETPTAD